MTGPIQTFIEVADGHILHSCCGKIDDSPHKNFCEHYRHGLNLTGTSQLGPVVKDPALDVLNAPHRPHHEVFVAVREPLLSGDDVRTLAGDPKPVGDLRRAPQPTFPHADHAMCTSS